MPAVRVLAFAGARDVVGRDELEVTVEPRAATAAGVLEAVCALFPRLAAYRAHIRLAVNGSYVDDDAPVAEGDEVALIPPVAGG